MPRFTAADPVTIKLRQNRKSTETFQLYRNAVAASDAGIIHLDENEKYGSVRRYLSAAAKVLDIKVRATYVESNHTVAWKRVL